METNAQHPEMEIFDIEEQEVLYQGIIALIQSGLPVGIRNGDYHHPIYLIEYSAEAKGHYPFDDFTPEEDLLFVTLCKLSLNLDAFGASKYKWFSPITTWSDFQMLITESAKKRMSK